ncbi:clan AA aspartic protease [Chamaesiphon minutus]|uniref:Clan AA aspartic protease, AF_0612 family n=1 Tax=Chamaesiphon minutus (strain ATCC 27169 / PCC 6605) TaxID=1173020 RepID=K9UB94_CHAP6|nr:clan AA aspartic protease [Chamaesiphon minutus]AFY92357.1 clan AA aspartic protease, AF_0612 family [Chamaesiphon minutus PCC 6605]
MIAGRVTEGRATVPVTFRMPDRSGFSIEFVIDTGFTGSLCLPPEAIAVLGLPFQYEVPANLANNSNVFLKVYTATILWKGETQEVNVFAAGRKPLLGVGMMSGNELYVHFIEGGAVSIE